MALRACQSTIVAIVCGVGVLGCVSTEKYPEGWEAVSEDTTQACPNIAGAYRDDGAGRAFSVPQLSNIFDGNKKNWVYSHTSIEQPDKEALVVRFWAKGKVEKTRTLHRSAGDFTCTGGRLVLASFGTLDAAGAGLGFAVGGDRIHFELMATPKALVAERRDSASGVAFILLLPVPMIGWENNWYRYERSQPSVPGE